MGNKIVRLIILFGVGILSGCSHTMAVSSSDASLPLPNVLIVAQGAQETVWLRRPGWTDYSPVSFGAIVETGDLLRVMKGGEAAVFCGSPDLWSKGALSIAADGKEHGIPCQRGAPPRPWPDVSALRGKAERLLPYVITPRNTALLSNTPDLDWHNLPDVTSYNVTLISNDELVRPSVQVEADSTKWPVEWAPIQGGFDYVLIVEGAGKYSDDANKTHSRLGFWLLDEKTMAGIEIQTGQIKQAGLDPVAQELLIADLYRNYQLRAEALKLLERISSAYPSPYVYLRIGEIYLETGNSNEAQIQFELAYKLAQSKSDLEAQAQAQYGSGLTWRAMNDENAANTAFREARKIFTAIGDQDSILEIDSLLKP